MSGMDPQIFKLITDYGLAIIGLIFVTRFLVWLIKYILDRHKIREDCYITMMNGDLRHLVEAMTTLTNTMATFTTSVNDAHKYQRDEHKEILDAVKGR